MKELFGLNGPYRRLSLHSKLTNGNPVVEELSQHKNYVCVHSALVFGILLLLWTITVILPSTIIPWRKITTRFPLVRLCYCGNDMQSQ